MRIHVLIFILAYCFSGATLASDADDAFTIYLVRHAEKAQDGSRDPKLTEIGIQRSERLATWFGDKNIEVIWSSDYKRTRNTATPIIANLEIDLTLYDPRNLSGFTEELLVQQRNALVVGHSNTTPELARLLCDCEIADMDESEHDRLIMISIHDGEAQAKTLQQR